jgi:hypothetical protein
MKKIIFALTIIGLIGYFSINNNSLSAGTTVGQCSYEISIAIGAGDCDTVGNCWYNIAKKIAGNPSCGSVACTTCDVAQKIASAELKKYNGLTVGNCSAAIADHLGVTSGAWATSVCNIAEKVSKTKTLK